MYSQSHVISCYRIDKLRLYFSVSRNSRSYLRNATSWLVCFSRKRCYDARARASAFCMLTSSLIYSEIISHRRFIIREAIRVVRLAWNLEAMAKLLVPRDILVASSASSCLRPRRCTARFRGEPRGSILRRSALNTWPCSRKTGKIYGPSKHGRA